MGAKTRKIRARQKWPEWVFLSLTVSGYLLNHYNKRMLPFACRWGVRTPPLQELKSTKILISFEMKVCSSFSSQYSRKSLHEAAETWTIFHFDRNQDFLDLNSCRAVPDPPSKHMANCYTTDCNKKIFDDYYPLLFLWQWAQWDGCKLQRWLIDDTRNIVARKFLFSNLLHEECFCEI